MIDPTAYDDRTDDDVFYYNGYSGSEEFVLWVVLFTLIAAIFGFGFFCGSVFA